MTPLSLPSNSRAVYTPAEEDYIQLAGATKLIWQLPIFRSHRILPQSQNCLASVLPACTIVNKSTDGGNSIQINCFCSRNSQKCWPGHRVSLHIVVEVCVMLSFYGLFGFSVTEFLQCLILMDTIKVLKVLILSWWNLLTPKRNQIKTQARWEDCLVSMKTKWCNRGQ